MGKQLSIMDALCQQEQEHNHQRSQPKRKSHRMHLHSLEAYNKLRTGSQKQRIVHAVFAAGSITRNSLADRLCIPLASVCGRAKELIDAGLLEEKGFTKMDGFKRALLRISKNAKTER